MALAALRGVQSPPGARKAAADVRWQRGTWHWQRSEECSLAPHDYHTSRRPGAHKAVVGGRAGAEAVHVLDLTEAVGRATAQNDTIAFVVWTICTSTSKGGASRRSSS